MPPLPLAGVVAVLASASSTADEEAARARLQEKLADAGARVVARSSSRVSHAVVLLPPGASSSASALKQCITQEELRGLHGRLAGVRVFEERATAPAMTPTKRAQSVGGGLAGRIGTRLIFFPSLKTQQRQTGRRPCTHRHLGVGRRVQTDRKADHGEGQGKRKGAGENEEELWSFFLFAFDDDGDFEFSSSTTLSTPSLTLNQKRL